MTDIYIIRHAEAEGNYYRRAHGTYNSNLTAFGYRQLPCLTKRFENEKIDAVYSSNLKRAMETAKSLAEPRGLSVLIDPELRETCVGECEDRPWGNLAWLDPVMMYRYNNDPMNCDIPGGEPAVDTQIRMLAVIRKLAARHDGQRIALFSHGGAIRLLMAAIRGTPSNQIRWTAKGDNTGVTLLRVDGEHIEIVYEGDNSHLPDELSGLIKQKWWLEDGEKAANPRLEPWEPEKMADFYAELYAEAWKIAHGDADFDAAPYLRRAIRKHESDPSLIMVAMDENTPIGLIEMDDLADEDAQAGHISFYAMAKAYRGKRYSPLMMGEAISRYRNMGRVKLRLYVAPDNHRAEGYYEHLGFKKVSITEGALGILNVMEKDIRV